jgi:hypothetical protein
VTATEQADEATLLAYLRTPRAIRERAAAVLALGEADRLAHFAIELAALPGVVDRVLALVRARYPSPAQIPYHSRWRHFDVGGVDRAGELAARLGPGAERLRARFELAITSVLLDAGSGPAWSFREAETGLRFTRSEGLAVASYRAFAAGAFSSDRSAPRADAAGLGRLGEQELALLFQVGPDNPLVGLAPRATMLRQLGQVVATATVFARDGVRRLGHLSDFLVGEAPTPGVVAAPAILAAVLEWLGPIWPGRHTLAGANLGDVWPHPQVGWVPFHKLSQWLTYSLVEPLEEAGVRVTELEALTGLAEYRNGGLFLDGGVLRPRQPSVMTERHPVGAPAIVEWRALTVALLDRTAAEVRGQLGLSPAALPLAKVLEAGTWAAGRAIAAERRPGGPPPIQVDSDGTVF